jgi:hypothetical protein
MCSKQDGVGDVAEVWSESLWKKLTGREARPASSQANP